MDATPLSLDSHTRIASLRSQHGDGLLGVPCSGLRLSWTLESTEPATMQRAYQIAHGEKDGELTPGDIVESSAQIGVLVGDITAGTRHRFSVRVRTEAGWTDWSAPLAVETAPEALTAQVIGIPTEIEGPVALLRREFTLDTLPTTARLHLTALGVVDAWINGQPATDAVLTPGWTSYQERILVDTLDVTPLLRPGTNVIVLAVGDGWYRGRMGFSWRTEIYGTQSGALAQLDTENGTVIATDTTWRGGFGAARQASIYDGSTVDLRLSAKGVHEPGFDDRSWQPVHVISSNPDLFEPRSAPPIRVVAERDMLPLMRTLGDGTPAVQLNAQQNVSGWVRLTVRGNAGDTITVKHAEVLEPSGDLHTAALRSATSIDTYVLDRDGEHVLEPPFTFHGFQYAEVTGAQEVVSATAVAISSDLPVRSSFRSASTALNQFHSNVFWSQRDNFVSVPTDCPQRDERLGWTGDAQAFAPTASTLMHADGFWRSWLRDLEADQTDEGGVASVVPDIIRPGDMHMGAHAVNPMGRAGWADAATIVPWAVYESTGSTEVLEQQLDSMRRWVAHLERRAGTEVLLPKEPFQYGDWLDPDAPGDRPWMAKVSEEFVANAFYVRSARLLARTERLVGDAQKAVETDALADRVAAATWERWSDEAFRTQTGAALALEFGVAPHDERRAVADALAANVRGEEGRIATGFLGTPLVLFALSNSGHLNEAFQMLLRREAPSWLYQVDRGATTVWERWDAILPDGSIHSGAMDAGSENTEGGGNMLSFNHYAYGAMIDWVYRTVAGLIPAEAGYRVTRIAPRPAIGLDHAAASIDTGYGTLAIDWRVAGTVFEATVDVPVGVRALLDLPVTAASEITVNDAPAPESLGSGRHRLVVTAPAVVAVASE